MPERAPISHLALVERADVYLIAPASANTIAKLAPGAADNLVTTAALAAACPVVVAPAMNNRMYLNAATQANLRILEERGVTVIPPGDGRARLARRARRRPAGRARGAAGACAALLMPADRDPREWPAIGHVDGRPPRLRPGAAGGCSSPPAARRSRSTASATSATDSSGRMGYALGAEALERGAEVTLVSANVRLEPPEGVRVVPVRRRRAWRTRVREEFPSCDVLLMAAAVADFRPAAPAAHKLKKTSARGANRIELEPTEDVLSRSRRSDGLTSSLVGFAAEHGDGAAAYGREKLERKGLDAIVVNDISRADIGFDSDQNEVVILTRDGGEHHVPRTAKDQVADAVLARCSAPRQPRTRPPSRPARSYTK